MSACDERSKGFSEVENGFHHYGSAYHAGQKAARSMVPHSDPAPSVWIPPAPVIGNVRPVSHAGSLKGRGDSPLRGFAIVAGVFGLLYAISAFNLWGLLYVAIGAALVIGAVSLAVAVLKAVFALVRALLPWAIAGLVVLYLLA